ncbi:MAG: phage tail sheath subtilisin-like domain-containing protein [Methylobacter sp.]|jgi:phage tail sheath protein FI|uniref:phage tail sheath family protein n=1 Tax=Methylobacter sp. TaxID=2051955 RepID=UPI0025DA796F|nr:phage tail sheath C-terminal domain-containing protein [Methylobacter sp.]MCK9621354.1 phage tail sheath subtilisin-like domain-containing protein [Methylobacter sp.]
MPEYLAPGVYVEEIDTGSKPIEGVSTSTAGMIGVTERGPVNVPILITSYGEYRRWFGERLNKDLYGEHRFLPYAVEGFFTNGGKRSYITRVLSTNAASLARTLLFMQEEGVPTATLLTRAPSFANDVLFVWAGAVGTIVAKDWVRIGTGSDAEYSQAVAPPTVSTTSIVTGLPLWRSHQVVANNVENYNTLPTVAVTRTLVGGHNASATSLTITGASGAVVVPDRLIQIGKAGLSFTNEELIYIRSAVDLGDGNWRVELDTSLQLDHADGEEVRVLNALPSPPSSVTQLTRDAVGGDTTLVVTANSTFAPKEFVRVVEGTRGEFRRVGAVHAIAFGVSLVYEARGGAYVEHVTRADSGVISVKILDALVNAGAMALLVDNRQGLSIGQVLRVGAPNDPDVEYVVIRDLPNRSGTSPDPGRIVLETPLAHAHGGASIASRQIIAVQVITTQAEAATIIHELNTSATSGLITASLLTVAPTINDLIRIIVPGTVPVYLRLVAHKALTVQQLKLTAPLLQPHAAPQPVVERHELMMVFALDPGVWGNRLRIATRRETTPLVRSRIRNDPSGIQDPIHIRLDSAAGVEIGTILSLTDGQGTPIDMPFKVDSIDRQNGYLLTLNTALPAVAALGMAVVSIEFSLSVFLLRQLDPAQPSRNNQILDAETFRNLSLDDRHSRYVHHVIGTTWVSGASDDKDGRPLRLSDRRSEGESVYVRVRDRAQDLVEPNRTNILHSIRLGPEFLVDLVNGRQESARRVLIDGDDQIGTLIENDYIGQDDPNPENRTGLHSLRNIEEISIVACPGQTSLQIQNGLINHCELMRYRFAVLDAQRPPNDTLADVQNQRQQFDTKYAALYHPWLLIPDPYPTNLAHIADYPIPPSGHMLGIYARTDIERGVHKAPANEVVRGILGLQRLLNKEQHDILNPYPVNINVIRDFRNNNRGIRVYGGRVITSDSDWKYVNVRRLLIFIESSIDKGLQWVVFEPNAEPLWARVRRSISNFLTLVWRNGGLEGTKVEEAYFVKCDRTTMTQTDIDSGRLIVVIGVAPVKPAEYVIVRIGLWTAHADD